MGETLIEYRDIALSAHFVIQTTCVLMPRDLSIYVMSVTDISFYHYHIFQFLSHF